MLVATVVRLQEWFMQRYHPKVVEQKKEEKAEWVASEAAVFAQQLHAEPVPFIASAALEPISEVGVLVSDMFWVKVERDGKYATFRGIRSFFENEQSSRTGQCLLSRKCTCVFGGCYFAISPSRSVLT